MSARAFFVCTCGVFVVVGPLLPLPVMAVAASISTGDLSKMVGALEMFRISWLTYAFGWPIAFGFGLAFSLICVAANRFIPALSGTKPGAGLALGALLGAFLAILVEIVWMRGHHLPTFFSFLAVPAAACGAIVGYWFFPRLSAELSLKS
jgi:hypothetical protein